MTNNVSYSLHYSRLFVTSFIQILLFFHCFHTHMRSIYSYSWKKTLSSSSSFSSSSSSIRVGRIGIPLRSAIRTNPWKRAFTASLHSSAPSRSEAVGTLSSLPSPPTSTSSSSSSASSTTAKTLNLDIDLPTNENSENLLRIRHSSAHVMAMAVQRLFPEIKVTIGPWIDNGFYYDFYVPEEKQLTPADLKKIKKEMERIIRSNYPILREEVSAEEARRRIEEAKEPFKLEILESILSKDASSTISIYHIGKEWWDLCAGPHVESTGKLPSNAIDIQNLAGAYWRGDETKPMLQRVYGTAWENKEQLEIFKFRQEEAKLRDHRTIGKTLNLFSIQNEAGGGLVFWHSKGSIVRRLIEDYWKQQHLQNGYEILYTPHIANLNLWKTSGHFDFYRNDMFRTMEVENEEYQIKPMNCPFHCLLFKDTPKSYRDLPIRWAELGTVYRYERSGTLHGLFRVRGFTQDDAHIFCLPEQLEQEILQVLQLIEKILIKFGFQKFDIMLSTRPKESVGSDEIWEKATNALIAALKKKGWDYSVDEGGGAFYGPKIDVKIRDAIGRKWQCSTVQCDFNLPERFQLEYTSSEGSGNKLRPIMVHRAIFGSLERFFGILIENSKGEFPFWLAPVQIKLLPVVEDALSYCEEVKTKLSSLGIRAEIDTSGNRIAKLIRTASEEKIPLTAVIGLQETQKKTLALRVRGSGDIGSYRLDDSLFTVLKQLVDNEIELKKESFAKIVLPATTTTITSESDTAAAIN